MKKKPTRKAVAPPPLSSREQEQERARRALRRSLARTRAMRKLVRQVRVETSRRDRDVEALTRQLMDYCGLAEAEAPAPPSSEDAG